MVLVVHADLQDNAGRMSQLLGLLGLSLLLGIVARRSGRFPAQTPLALNAFIIHVALPALVLREVHRLKLDPRLLVIALTPWLVFAGAWLLMRGVGPRLGLGPRSVALGDLDGDGDLDVAVGNTGRTETWSHTLYAPGTVVVLFNDGHGRLSEPRVLDREGVSFG